MKPPVISGCKLESEFIVLVIIFSNINIIAVGGAVVERLVLDFGFFIRLFALDIAKFDQLLFDLYEIIFRQGNV